MTTIREIPVLFLGLGNVGRALLRQLLDSRVVQVRRLGMLFVPVALADAGGLLDDPAGLSEPLLHQALQVTAEGRLLDVLPGARPLSAVAAALRPGAVMADLTASTETKPLLRQALEVGCGVALANKHPMAAPWAEAEPFYEHPLLRYEVTVGAGLPVIAGLRSLLDTGDHPIVIEGCLSGTLGYLCAQLEQGVPYSVAVAQARSLGYTEPDPREDLSGRDVARKALILARTAGWPLEMASLTVEALYSDALAALPTEEFLAAAATLDEEYAQRVRQAQAGGQTLRYVARVGPEGGQVGLLAVPKDGPLGALRGPANYISLRTTRYDETPLVFAGPGAGPEVTAAGVFADIIGLAMRLG